MIYFENELASIKAFKAGNIPSNYIVVSYEGASVGVLYVIHDTERGFCGEDKLHWSEPVCTTEDRDDALLIVHALNIFQSLD